MTSLRPVVGVLKTQGADGPRTLSVQLITSHGNRVSPQVLPGTGFLTESGQKNFWETQSWRKTWQTVQTNKMWTHEKIRFFFCHPFRFIPLIWPFKIKYGFLQPFKLNNRLIWTDTPWCRWTFTRYDLVPTNKPFFVLLGEDVNKLCQIKLNKWKKQNKTKNTWNTSIYLQKPNKVTQETTLCTAWNEKSVFSKKPPSNERFTTITNKLTLL